MVSYEELIYNFVDIYLKTAMECSICKESYNMTDDVEFLDEYMKFFISLLLSVEKDETLDLFDVKRTLEKRKQEKIIEFQIFLQRQVVEAAMESTKKMEYCENSMINSDMYIKEIERFYTEIFDKESAKVKDSPVELLRYMRMKEEFL